MSATKKTHQSKPRRLRAETERALSPLATRRDWTSWSRAVSPTVGAAGLCTAPPSWLGRWRTRRRCWRIWWGRARRRSRGGRLGAHAAHDDDRFTRLEGRRCAHLVLR